LGLEQRQEGIQIHNSGGMSHLPKELYACLYTRVLSHALYDRGGHEDLSTTIQGGGKECEVICC
jgi:hypothetical protein